MELIPAVDIKAGRCVRLLKGRKSQETKYSENPLQMARHWEEEGATRLHVVDLDGAFEEETQNKEIISNILQSLSIPVQVGGGLRSLEGVRQVLHSGADRAIIGTAGIKRPEFLKELLDEFDSDSITAGVDVKDKKVMVRGWEENSQYHLSEWIDILEQLGINDVIYTDIDRDGTRQGPDIDGTKEILSKTSMGIIASGGVGSLDDVKKLKSIDSSNLNGVIVGRALYEREFAFQEAMNILD